VEKRLKKQKGKMMKSESMVSWILLFIVFVLFAVGFVCWMRYGISKDVDAYIDRAQIAASSEDMLEYMQQVKGGMERHRMTEGHTVLIFKQANNDLSLHFRSVIRIIERLEEVQGLPKDETAYQVALDDLRGTIRELPNPAAGVVWVRYGWWLFLIGIILLILIKIGVDYEGKPQHLRRGGRRGGG